METIAPKQLTPDLASRPGRLQAFLPAWTTSALVRFGALLAFATFLGLLFSTQIYLGMLSHGHDWWRLFVWQASTWWLWALLVPVVLWLARRYPLYRPVRISRFAEAVARAKATLHSKEVEKVSERLVGLIQDRRDQSARTPNSSPNRLMIRSSGRVYFVKIEEIDWIEAADYYARIHAGGRSHLLRESLASLEEKLDSEQFARVHRSAIVNMDRVKEMRPLFKGSHALVLEDGTQLWLSRQRRAELEERLSQSS